MMRSFIICRLLFTKHHQDDRIKEDEMDEACSAHGRRNEKYVLNFSRETRREDAGCYVNVVGLL
jgi:hypothetical protein